MLVNALYNPVEMLRFDFRDILSNREGKMDSIIFWNVIAHIIDQLLD